MYVFIGYQVGTAAALSASVIDLKTGNVFSPAAKGFVPDAPDALVALAKPQSANHQSFRTGFFADVPAPEYPDQYLVTIHPAAGGEPLDRVPFVPPATSAVRVAVAVGSL